MTISLYIYDGLKKALMKLLHDGRRCNELGPCVIRHFVLKQKQDSPFYYMLIKKWLNQELAEK